MLKIGSIIVGVLISALLIWFAFRFIQRGRAVDLNPSDVKITDITQNSFTVQYTTRAGLTPVVLYGSDPTSLSLLAPATDVVDVGGGSSLYKHVVSPVVGETYYAKVQISPDQIVDNNGAPFMIQLSAVPSTTATASPTAAAAIPSPTSVPTTVTPAPTVNIDLCCAEKVDTDGDGQTELKIPDVQGCTAMAAVQCMKKKEAAQ